MKRILTKQIPEAVQLQIIERWRTVKLNSIPLIAAEFECSVYQVHNIINKYLSTKT